MIVGILLAAGKSTRFGAPKLLAPLPDGRRLIEAAAQTLQNGVEQIIAVVRPDADLIAVLNALKIKVVLNERAEEGMGASIAAGVQATADATGWLIALGDMPCIRPSTIVQMTSALAHQKGIVVPQFQGRRGHPVGFAKCFQSQLLALRGDTGAKSIIEGHFAQLTTLDVDDPGIVLDIDFPHDITHVVD